MLLQKLTTTPWSRHWLDFAATHTNSERKVCDKAYKPSPWMLQPWLMRHGNQYLLPTRSTISGSCICSHLYTNTCMHNVSHLFMHMLGSISYFQVVQSMTVHDLAKYLHHLSLYGYGNSLLRGASHYCFWLRRQQILAI